MDNAMLVELIGYLGSGLVLASFLMSSVVKLRVVNAVGGTVFAVYALIIQSYPTALMNVALVAINIYYLARLKKKDRHFDMIDGNTEDAFVNYFLTYYKDDIKKYFPEWNTEKGDTAYLVCCDAVPAGILLGKTETEGTLNILLDYATPAYRDCSVGNYLYAQLSMKGIRRLTFSGKAENYEAYLAKMGFTKENDIYVK